jgi:hypothetical protein
MSAATISETNQHLPFKHCHDIDDAPHKREGLRAFGDRGLFQDIPNPGNNGCKNLFIKRISVAKVDMDGEAVNSSV